jgi:acyl CoA:acetate/3-ketoacid CoA transferase alpha subunit
VQAESAIVRLRIAAKGVSFGVVLCTVGTDTFMMSAAKIVACPFTGNRYVALPEVAAIYAHKADIDGNCHTGGLSIVDFELVRTAKNVIMTTERADRVSTNHHKTAGKEVQRCLSSSHGEGETGT